MKVLGVDPGYGRIGFAVIEDAKEDFNLIHSECLSTSSDKTFEERLKEIIERFEMLMTKHNPDICSFEKLFFVKNKKTAMRVAEVRGALIYSATANKIPVVEYEPSSIKKTLTGDGRADKIQIQKFIEYVIKFPDDRKRIDDEYDAIAIGISGVILNKKKF